MGIYITIYTRINKSKHQCRNVLNIYKIVSNYILFANKLIGWYSWRINQIYSYCPKSYIYICIFNYLDFDCFWLYDFDINLRYFSNQKKFDLVPKRIKTHKFIIHIINVQPLTTLQKWRRKYFTIYKKNSSKHIIKSNKKKRIPISKFFENLYINVLYFISPSFIHKIPIQPFPDPPLKRQFGSSNIKLAFFHRVS